MAGLMLCNLLPQNATIVSPTPTTSTKVGVGGLCSTLPPLESEYSITEAPYVAPEHRSEKGIILLLPPGSLGDIHK